MRSWSNQRQAVWFTRREKVQSGIDTVYQYSTPKKHKLSVSSTSGTPEEINAGIVPSYDRYITVNKFGALKNIDVRESDCVFVDVTPQLDDNGNLVMDSDGIEPVTPPDYVVKKVIDTQRGVVARYGIVKRDGNEE